MPVKRVGLEHALAEPVALREDFDTIGRCSACATAFAWEAPVWIGAVSCLSCRTGEPLAPTRRNLAAGFVHLSDEQLTSAMMARSSQVEVDDLEAASCLARREERRGQTRELDALTEGERLTTAELGAHRGERCNRCQLEISWRRRQPQRPLACPLCGRKMIAGDAKRGTRVLSAKAANKLARQHAVQREDARRVARVQRKASDAAYRRRHAAELVARSHARSDFSDHGAVDALGVGTSEQPGRLDYYLALLADPCAYCGERRAGLMTRDHIVPRGAGGDDGWENAIGVCGWCNSAKADQPLLLWLMHQGVAAAEQEISDDLAPSVQPKYWTAIAVPEGTLYAQYRAAKFGQPDWGSQLISPERWYVSLSTRAGQVGAAGQRPVGSTALLQLGFDPARAAALEDELVARIWPDAGDGEICDPWPPAIAGAVSLSNLG